MKAKVAFTESWPASVCHDINLGQGHFLKDRKTHRQQCSPAFDSKGCPMPLCKNTSRETDNYGYSGGRDS